MLDIFEFLEEQKKPQLPSGFADLSVAPKVVMPKLTPSPLPKPRQIAPMVGPQPTDRMLVGEALKPIGINPVIPQQKRDELMRQEKPSLTPIATTFVPADRAMHFRDAERPAATPTQPVATVPGIKDIISDFRAIGGTSALPARPAAPPVPVPAPADLSKDFRQQEKDSFVGKSSIDAITRDDTHIQQEIEENGNRFIQSLGRGFEELGKGIVKGLTVYTPPKEGKERGIAGRILDWAYTSKEDATFADKANNIVGEMLGNLPFYLMGEGLITKAVKTFGPATTLGLSAQAIKGEAARQAIPTAETALGRILQSGVRSAGQLAPRLGTLSMARQVAQEAANPQEGMMQRVGISAGEGLVAGAVFGFTFGAIAQAYPEARFKIQVMRAGRKVALPKDAPQSFTHNEVQAEISRLIDEGWRYDPKRGMFTDPNNPTYAATIYVEHQGKSIRLTEILKQYGGEIPSGTTLASSIRKTTSGTMRPAPIETKPPMPKATVPTAQTAGEMGIRLSEGDVSKIVFQKLVGQGNTPQVAQEITKSVTDTLHSAGLELNMNNISKHFGDMLTISAEDIATAGKKGIAKAEVVKEGIAKTKETIYQKVVEQGVEPEQAEQVINEISNELSRQGKEFTIDNVLADYGEVLGMGMPKAETPAVRELPDLPEPPAQSMEEIKRSMQEHQRKQKEGQIAEQNRLKAEQGAEAQQREEELRIRTEEMRERVARLMEREGLTGEVPGDVETLPGEIGGISGKAGELPGKTEGVADKGVPPALSPKVVNPAGVNKKVSDFSPPATGKTATAKTIEGTEIKTKYAIVDANADDLAVSHNTDLKENPNYPQELQPRDRTRIASEVQINKIMQKMEPSWLGASPKASDGAPIVGKDGVVESGNGRIIALQKIYKTGHKNKELYKKWLNDNIEQFGISKRELSSIKNPILVRVRQSDVDRIKFVEEANKRSTAPMSDSELANLDAKKITGELMELFVPTDSGEILTAANRKFVSAFLSNVIGQAEMGEYITDDGGVSQKGLTRIRNAIFARAFGENEAIKKLAEINDVNVRNQINAMLMVAPKLIKMKESIEKGSLHDLDISEEIAAAMNKLSALRSAGTSVQDYLRQMSLLEEDLNPLAKDVLMLFDKNKRSAKKIAAILQAYTEAASVTGNPQQRTLVETKKPTKAEILEYAVREAEGLNEKQIDVFSSQRIGSAGDKKAGAGTQAESKAAAGEGEKTGALAELQDKLGKKVDEAVGDVSPPIGMAVKIVNAPPMGRGTFSSSDPDVDARVKAAHGVKSSSTLHEIRHFMETLANKATREYEHLPGGAKFAQARFDLLKLAKQKGVAGDKVLRMIQGILVDIGKDRVAYNHFEWKVLLNDLAEEASMGHDLPFGYTKDILQKDIKKMDGALKNFPGVEKALQTRRDVWDVLTKEYIKAQKAIEHDVEGKLNRKEYFRHMVMEYANERVPKGTGRKLRTPTGASYLRKRKGSTFDINTNYLEAEYEVMAQMLYDIERAKTIKAIDDNYNIAKRLKKDEDIPEGYVEWQPREGNIFYFADTISAKKAQELFVKGLSDINVKADEIRKVLAVGRRRPSLVIPEELALTLDNLLAEKNTDPVSRSMKAALRVWKEYQLISPRRYTRYNLRNISGDADAAFVGNPSTFTKAFQAAKELYRVYAGDGAMTANMRDWFERGGMESTLQVQEMGEVNNLKMFIDLVERRGKITDLPVKAWKGYWKAARLSTEYREAILRYAAYLDYMEQMRGSKDGRPKNFGASVPDEIMALKDIKDRAYWLSNDLLGAYDKVSVLGQYIRDHIYPFWSWKEVNFKRYIRMFKNAARDDKLAGAVGRAFSAKLKRSPLTAIRVGSFLIKAIGFWSVLQIYNMTRFPDEEKELPANVRNTPHIILGRDKDGKIEYFSRLGAMGDFLGMMGLEEFPQHARDFLNGKKSMKEIGGDIAKDAINEYVQGVGPQFKIPVEILMGKKIFPDVFRPGTIRDMGYYLAQSAGLENEYAQIAKLPSRPYAESLKTLAMYKLDPGQGAYYEIQDLKREFLKKIGKPGGYMGDVTPKSQALYNIKLSIRYGDKKAFEKYVAKYVSYGGTAKGLKTSIQNMHPLKGLNKDEQKAFLQWLDEEDRQRLGLAVQFYKDTLLGGKEEKQG